MDTPLERIRRAELEGVRHWFRPALRVLEIGGGSGFQAAMLASWGCDVVSLDLPRKPSPQQQRFQKQYFGVQPYDGAHIPFGDASFDLVYSSNMLYHALPLRDFLLEIRRVLRPGGTALHILPSASWRCWTSLAHYVYVAGAAGRKLGLRRPVEAGPPAPDAGPGVIVREPLRRRVLRLLRADPLGPYSPCAELFVFRRARWVKAFQGAGYERVEALSNDLFYTGYLFCPDMPLARRRRLAAWLGSSCHVIAMRTAAS